MNPLVERRVLGGANESLGGEEEEPFGVLDAIVYFINRGNVATVPREI